MSGGRIYDLEGNPIAVVDDLEGTFLGAIAAAATREQCYVVTDGSRPEFVERVKQLGVAVVIDSLLEGRALVMAGDPSEWDSPGEG